MNIQPGVWVPFGDLTKSQRRRLTYGIQDLYDEIEAENTESDRDTDQQWDVDAYRVALARLRGEGRAALATVIETARDQGGYISREKVYEITEYDPTRSLRGFTRPVRRICEAMRAEGILPEESPDLLEADYDEGVSGYQKAGGFTVPDEVVDLDWEPEETGGRIDHSRCGHPMTKAARAQCRQERRAG